MFKAKDFETKVGGQPLYILGVAVIAVEGGSCHHSCRFWKGSSKTQTGGPPALSVRARAMSALVPKVLQLAVESH